METTDLLFTDLLFIVLSAMSVFLCIWNLCLEERIKKLEDK